MTTTLLLDCFMDEKRLALIRDSQLVDLQVFYRPTTTPREQQIYWGRVRDISASLNAAFVDLGDGQDGLLPARAARPLARDPSKQKSERIEQLVHEGQMVLVQVARTGRSDKQPRLTARLELSHPLMIYRPFGGDTQLSKRISNDDHHQRLQQLAPQLLKGHGGLSFRHRAADFSDAQLKDVFQQLHQDWSKILGQTKSQKNLGDLSIGLTHYVPDWLMAVENHLLHEDLAGLTLLTNDADCLLAIRHRATLFGPPAFYNEQLRYDNPHRGLFAAHDLEDEWDSLWEQRLPLQGLPGSWISIEQTEALTAIDVNMGSAQPHTDRAQAILTLNIQAAHEIARQLRLRNIGGLIVIDFVDMAPKAHKEQLLAAFDGAVASDPTPPQRGHLSSFGLLELSRPAKGPGLTAQLGMPHPTRLAARPRARLYQKLHQIAQDYQAGQTAALLLTPAEWHYMESQPLETQDDFCHLFQQRTGIILKITQEETT